MSETEKKNEKADETLENIKKFLDYNKNAQLASKVDKGKSKSKTEESIAERTILSKEMVAKIEKEEKNIFIKAQVTCTKNNAREKVKKMRIKYMQSKKC